MPEPLTPQHDEPGTDLQAQLASLQQANIDLRLQLQTCEEFHATLQVELAADRQQEQVWQGQAAIACSTLAHCEMPV